MVTNALIEGVLNSADYRPSLDYDYRSGTAIDAAGMLARLLLFTPEKNEEIRLEPKHPRGFAEWYAQLPENKKRHISVWLYEAIEPKYLHPFIQFDKNPNIRVIFELFLSQNPYPPYLTITVLNLIRIIFGLSLDKMAEITSDDAAHMEWTDRLFNEPDKIRAWLAEPKPMELRYYTGATNTILGLYDYYVKQVYEDDDFDACYDLGGGFSTSEIARLTGKTLISADLNPPDMTLLDARIVVKKAMKGRFVALDEWEMTDYLERQAKVPWMKFDVATNSFPKDRDNYLITSTGFMTSTVRAADTLKALCCAEPILMSNNYMITSLMAMYRVIELVRAGKKVSLLTVNRATSRYYSFRVVWLKWKDGKITQFRTVPYQNSKPKIYAEVLRALEQGC